MLDQDQIINFLKVTGPTIPAKVAKNIRTDILLASALLSDLAAQGKIKISKLKIGGSPLYYLPGQEEQLYHFAFNNLNPKDFAVLEQLKEKKVLREKELDLLSKVALRSLKDFSVPLNVTIQGQAELFWKWHLSSSEEANNLIGQMITGISPEKPAGMLVKPEEPEISHSKSEQERIIGPQPKPIREEKAEPKKEEQIKLEHLEEKKIVPPAKTKEKADRKTAKPSSGNFLSQIEKYFSSIDVDICQKEVLRKNSEINFIVKIPSVIGKITYFCKTKNKAKCDEKDLSAAYMEAQAKKLPLLFIYTNELTRKPLELLESGVFENVVVKKME